MTPPMRPLTLALAAASCAAVAGAATAATTMPTAPTPASPTPALSRNGLGPIAVGQTLAQAQRASGMRFQPPSGTYPTCRYAAARNRRLGLVLMVARQSRIVRLDVIKATYATAAGIRVGSTQKAALAAYPAATVAPHKYLPKGKEIWVGAKPTARSGRALVIETNGARVTGIRAGKLPQVGYVEGCA